MGNEIRKLQPTAQIYVKHSINNILFQAALGQYDRPNNTFQLCSASSVPYGATPSPKYQPSKESAISSETTSVNELTEFLNMN